MMDFREMAGNINGPFKIKPKHWWGYFNPFFWRRKKIVEAVLNYEYKKHEGAIQNAIKDAVLYGKGSFLYLPSEK